ncbi:hypothetical protein BRSU_1454 [Brachyspira suanatina]|uniref:Lipoprotein n=1 Tax=Brachyspira suanatina TaxID=381802 RepID=A0A0G4K6Z1_9SPIR|nr:hypothetical protein [Brachyspira suanatina]CRF33460.1 hypothetical protein BRSU_1454 [Brachyspira suanatina]
MNFIKSLFLILFITLLISCSDNKNDSEKFDIVPVDSTKSFAVLGYCVPVPEHAMNVKYAIVNKTIAESNFDYNNINYYYRASKNLNDLLVFYNNLKEERKNIDEETNIEITIQSNDKKEYIAYWNVNGIYYSLYSNEENGIYDLALVLMRNKALN